jgi:glucose/arabinose dehydrogenase
MNLQNLTQSLSVSSILFLAGAALCGLDVQGAQVWDLDTTIQINTVPISNPISARIPKGTLTIELRTVADNLISPLGMAVPDDGSGRRFIYDQAGLVHILTSTGLLSTPLLDVRSRLVTVASYDERGLLGLATHPNFSSHPLIYLHVRTSGWHG